MLLPSPRCHPTAPSFPLPALFRSCPTTGSILAPSIGPDRPVTRQEIARSAVEPAEAGAAIVHLHARNPEDGRLDQSPEAFQPFLRVIKQASNVVVNLT